jgi:hypothetical protein
MCRASKPVLKRPRNGARLCKACFLGAFEEEVHDTIVRHRLFTPGDRVAVGASGALGRLQAIRTSGRGVERVGGEGVPLVPFAMWAHARSHASPHVTPHL